MGEGRFADVSAFKSFKTKIAGIEVTVASEEECEKAAAVVCGPNSYFADDVRAQCEACGAAIVHRPYVPKGPPKICMQCWMTNRLPRQH